MAPDSIRQERPVDQIGGTAHVIGEVFDRSAAPVVAQSDGQLSRILYIVALRATVLNCRDEERLLSARKRYIAESTSARAGSSGRYDLVHDGARGA